MTGLNCATFLSSFAVLNKDFKYSVGPIVINLTFSCHCQTISTINKSRWPMFYLVINHILTVVVTWSSSEQIMANRINVVYLDLSQLTF